MRQSIYRAAVGSMLLSLASCAATTRYTQGEIPRDTYGEPAWALIEPSQPRPDHGPIYVPAGPPVRTVASVVVQPGGN